MPLFKSARKKAVGQNIKTEMAAGKPQKQSIAIALATQRKARGQKKAQGGEIRAASDKPTIDEMRKRSRDMLASKSTSHKPELDARKEHMVTEDDRDTLEMDMLAEGGELDVRKESLSGNSIDDAWTSRDEDMLDNKPLRHMDEKRATSKMVDEDSEDSMEMDMMHQKNQLDEYSKNGLINYADGGRVYASDAQMLDDGDSRTIAEYIRRKMKMMARGGEVDLQDNNGDEHLNMEDQQSFDAARKDTYFDDSQLRDQPEDSNEHGHELSDEDEHSMVSKIRRGMRNKKF